MTDTSRPIFRTTAIRNYAQGRAKSVLPQFVRPRAIVLLWVLAGMLLGIGVLAWLIRIPIYASGVGVVVDSTANHATGRLAVFLPAQELSKLRTGQKLSWSLDKTGARTTRTLVAIDSEVSSPRSVQTRFNLTGAASTAITKPVVVAFVDLEPTPGNLSSSALAGSIYRVDVEVGTMRVISLLPFARALFGD
jgi:hypothetical protein